MAVYSIYTKIESNVPADNLLYDLSIYRMDENKKKFYLLPLVSQQSLQSNYETLKHQTVDTDDPLITTYIVEIMLYRKNMLLTQQALKEPFRRLYTLDDLASGKACSEKKRENACYFESSGQTKPANEGDNTIKLQLTVPERQFIAKEYPIGSTKDPFEKSLFEFELLQRMDHFDYPNQGGTSLCGPAAFFYCLLRDRPDIYEQAAKELWQYGTTKIGNLKIIPSKGCKKPRGRFHSGKKINGIKGLDWVTLASLRDSENSIMSYSEVSDRAAGITFPATLFDWFEKAGYTKIDNKTTLSHSNLEDIIELNNYFKDGYTIVSLISAGMFDRADGDTSWKNHWIVWNDVLRDTGTQDVTLDTDLNVFVNLDMFSWGEVQKQVLPYKTLAYFLQHTYGALIFKRII